MPVEQIVLVELVLLVAQQELEEQVMPEDLLDQMVHQQVPVEELLKIIHMQQGLLTQQVEMLERQEMVQVRVQVIVVLLRQLRQAVQAEQLVQVEQVIQEVWSLTMEQQELY